MQNTLTLEDMKDYKFDTSKYTFVKSKVVRCKKCGKLTVKESK